MKANRFTLRAAVAAVGLAAAVLICAPCPADTVPGRVIVELAPGADINGVASTYSLTVDAQVAPVGIWTLDVTQGKEAAVARVLNRDPRVVLAEPDTFQRNPEIQAQQFAFGFDTVTTQAPYTWQPAYTQVDLPVAIPAPAGGGVTVAVLDTGVDPANPSLASHLLPGWNLLDPGAPPLDAADGVTNAAAGHGTMIAGVIARVAPAALVLPIKVLDADGIGTTSGAVAGIYSAVFAGAGVINLSFGTEENSVELRRAVDAANRAGVVVVACAGNQGAGKPYYPAAYRSVIAVAAIQADGTLSTYSNYGAWLDVCAPGDWVASTYLETGYAAWTGTSVAAAFVSGEAALLAALHPGATPDAVRSAIDATAVPLTGMTGSQSHLTGNGIIDIGAALLH